MNYSATSCDLHSSVFLLSYLFIYSFNTFTSISGNYCVPWTVPDTESTYKQRVVSFKWFLIFSQSLFRYYFQPWVRILFSELPRIYFLSDISNISSHLTCHFEREWALPPLLLYFFSFTFREKKVRKLSPMEVSSVLENGSWMHRDNNGKGDRNSCLVWLQFDSKRSHKSHAWCILTSSSPGSQG